MTSDAKIEDAVAKALRDAMVTGAETVQNLAKVAVQAYQSTVDGGNLTPPQRDKLAEEIAAYFAGFSFSRDELKQCRGLVDVLLVRGYKITPPATKEA